jgi:hypothetical protein
LDALVLDVDTNSQILEGTIDQTMVQSLKENLLSGKEEGGEEDGKKKKKKKKAEKSNSSSSDSSSLSSILNLSQNISPGDLFRSATILLIKEKYLVVSIPHTTSSSSSSSPSILLCYVMIADYHCPYKDTSSYSIGQQIPIRIERILRKIIPSNEILTPYDQVTIASLLDEESDQHRTQSARIQKEIETSDAQLHQKLNQSSTEMTSSLRVGQTLQWIVEKIDTLQIHVRPETSTTASQDPAVIASIHLSSAIDHGDGCDDLGTSLEKFSSLKKKQKQLPLTPCHPFYEIKPGQVISAKIIHLWKKKEGGDGDGDVKYTTVATLVAQTTQGNGKLSPSLPLSYPRTFLI